MNENLFQFIWQHSLYGALSLSTTDGEPITIIFCGTRNTNAGPDFLEAKIKIGDTTLVGNIELHINSSDWLKHGHQNDAAYQHLILHVVYNNDVQGVAGNIPVLDLSKNVPQHIIARYSGLVQASTKLPCASQHATVKSITKEVWMSRLLAERWEEKLGEWNILLHNSAEDWRNLLYWRMAANFGFKVNATPFLLLAQSIPLNILARHKENLMQIEALLFGQAGMLNIEFTEAYPIQLKQEYEYLQKKYKLTPIARHLWKFMRLHPANFPTVRIAQFAALIHKSLHLFSQIIEINSVKEIVPMLDVIASRYWTTHYQFEVEVEVPKKKKLGESSIQNIVMNTIAPIQFLYAGKQDTSEMQERALQLLESVPAEKNHITRIWDDNGWSAKNAAQSQSLIQLYNNYCTNKRCLECTVGLNIIKLAPVSG